MEMKALVETVRPEKSKGKEKANVPSDEQPVEDSCEPGMKVPVSALGDVWPPLLQQKREELKPAHSSLQIQVLWPCCVVMTMFSG